jgi:hypothetical protein
MESLIVESMKDRVVASAFAGSFESKRNDEVIQAFHDCIPITRFLPSDEVIVRGQKSLYCVLVEGSNEVGIDIPFLTPNGSL